EPEFPGKALAMHMITTLTMVGALALLAACGSREPGRVQGGAAAGAATGAAIGLIGGPPGVAAGAVIGGGAGAITGASTTPKQVDLGKPLWDKPASQ
ncbi:MAG TPA: hypothetical protein VL133_09085, partial [Devosia sp.]|nr:hypothetical protein [Devosia sp.]